MKKKIAVYGGSFNPVHSGHAMVVNCLSRCDLFDELWIMVSRQNPLKESYRQASDEDRLKMVEFVAKRFHNVRVSDFEMNLPSPSYTIDTLRQLKIKYPETEISLVIGSDNWLNFKKWKEYRSILNEFKVLVYDRPGYELAVETHENVIFLSGFPKMDISSTYIRDVAARGENINFLVPTEVADYIKLKKLYK